MARRQRNTCYLNRPLYLGLAILDFAKTRMTEYWNGTVEKLFRPDPSVQLSVIMTDTGTFQKEGERERERERERPGT